MNECLWDLSISLFVLVTDPQIQWLNIDQRPENCRQFVTLFLTMFSFALIQTEVQGVLDLIVLLFYQRLNDLFYYFF